MPSSYGFAAIYSSHPSQPQLVADSEPLIWFCSGWDSWRNAPLSVLRQRVANAAGWGSPDGGAGVLQWEPSLGGG